MSLLRRLPRRPGRSLRPLGTPAASFATYTRDGQVLGVPASEDGHYDVIVIGSGAGIKISIPAARMGLRVAMCERGFETFGEHKTGLGGTCLNRGCIPSKMMIYPADVAVSASHARDKLDLNVAPPSFKQQRERWPALVDRITQEVDGTSNRLNDVYSQAEPSTKRDWYQQSARFVGPRKLRIGDRVITGDRVFVCSGSSPTIPDIPGLKDTPFMTSTEALRNQELPRRLAVMGGGYIAAELSHAYSAMGSQVSIIVRSKVLRTVDPEIREDFMTEFRERVDCLEATDVDRVEYNDDTKMFRLHLSRSKQDGDDKESWVHEADALLVATGFQPNTVDLNLEAAGIRTKGKGFVDVDECLRTSADGVYAFGDVAGNFLFRHSANYEGQYLAEHVLFPWAKRHLQIRAKQEQHANRAPDAPADSSGSAESRHSPFSEEGSHSAEHYPEIDYSRIPWAMFTNPQVAGVGLSQADLDLYNKFAELSKAVNLSQICEDNQPVRVLTDAEVAKAILDELQAQQQQLGDNKSAFSKGDRSKLVQIVRNLDWLECSQLERLGLHFRPLKYVIGRCRYKNSAQGDARRPDSGLAKIWVQAAEPRRVLGCVISGDEASILMHQVAQLMQVEGTLDDLLLLIYAHPALNEIVRNAARSARDELEKAGYQMPLKMQLA